MNCSLPGSSVHGIFQARVLEWGAIAFSRHTLNKPVLKHCYSQSISLCLKKKTCRSYTYCIFLKSILLAYIYKVPQYLKILNACHDCILLTEAVKVRKHLCQIRTSNTEAAVSSM
ncbi:unnamed protein product [Rangifer tarandus platyrhynchus]|uniref:Uncharacterized protein n=2 Tax=Rangifer tarandus platyrhynchus TaxID=3082113 RepID=A0AC59ZUF1_RANTA|nr:unnamed protein product [Rangifer tarandus platyrhynchus]